MSALQGYGIAVIFDAVYNRFESSDLDLWQFEGAVRTTNVFVVFLLIWKESCYTDHVFRHLLYPGPQLVYVHLGGEYRSYGPTATMTSILLAFTGIVTALPLLLFTCGARRVTLATVGVLQYVAPTLQFLLGVLVYGESFTTTRLVGFSVIWLALLMYSCEGVVQRRRWVKLERVIE